jgi:uncharacterized membrane protein YgaE (UPF0421/DUF939 family)
MQTRHFEAIVFSLKATIGAVAAALAYKFFGLPGAPWVAAVSAVLVTQLDLHSSLKASLLRVAANLAGALSGAILLAIIGKPIVAMALGVMGTSLICHLLKQDDALRPAAVAVILVTIVGGSSEWHSSFDRVTGVVIGCTCALIVGFLFDKLTGIIKLPGKEQKEKTKASE